MKTTEVLQRFEQITNHYLEELNGFSLEQLKQRPSDNVWSLGQMYLHLINSALYMQLRNADSCMTISEDSVASAEVKTEAGKAVFDQGSFPPIRIQVPPSPQYTPQQPENKEQIIEGLNAVLRRMKEIALVPAFDKVRSQNVVPHPRLGGLNAKEWFMLVEMHYRHHLLQKDRLKELLVNHAG